MPAVLSVKRPSSEDPDRVRRMYELYERGATLAQAGEAFGITRERVRQLFLVHRLPTRSIVQAAQLRRAREAADVAGRADEIMEAYREGLSTKQIARRYGVGEPIMRALIADWASNADVRAHTANAGQKPVAAGRRSIEPCVRAIRLLGQGLGRAPTYREYAARAQEEPSWPSGHCITSGWGWSVALAAAGFAPRQSPPMGRPRPSRISEERCWEALLTVSEHLDGRIPSHSEYSRVRNTTGDLSLPSVRVIRTRLGRWAEIVESWPQDAGDGATSRVATHVAQRRRGDT